MKLILDFILLFITAPILLVLTFFRSLLSRGVKNLLSGEGEGKKSNFKIIRIKDSILLFLAIPLCMLCYIISIFMTQVTRKKVVNYVDSVIGG